MGRGVLRVLSFLGLLLSMISVTRLLQIGFQIGFAEPLRLMLSWYDAVVSYLAQFVEPSVRIFLRSLADWVGWRLELHGHWKHVWVLTMIYMGTRARTVWAAGLSGTAMLLTALGLAMALACGVTSGLLPLTDASGTAIPSTRVFVVVVLWIVAYEVLGSAYAAARWHYAEGEQWWRTFTRNLPGDLTILVVAAFALLLGELLYKLPALTRLVNPGLAFVGIVIVAVATYWILANVVARRRPRKESWWEQFRRSNNARFGRAVFIVFGGVALFLMFNAGLSALGL